MALNGINPNAVVNAYSNSQNISGISGGDIISNPKDVNSDGASFADLLKNNIEKSIDTMRSGEDMTAKAISGEANLTDVVQAVTSAELTLQTVVSVRDKMISAYQDIMRMPI